MSGLWDWLRSRRRRPLAEYDETKGEFERVMGQPRITVTVELPEDLEGLREEFLSLEKDESFVRAVRELAERRLKQKRASRKRGP